MTGLSASAEPSVKQLQTSKPTADDSGKTSPDSCQSPSEGEALSKDLAFSLLSAGRRRNVLKYMAENGAETTLSELAEQISAKENGIDSQRISSKQRKRVYVALYQCHLPKMDDASVIDFNQARGTVKLRPEANELLHYLEIAQPDQNNTNDRSGLLSSQELPGIRAKLGRLVPL